MAVSTAAGRPDPGRQGEDDSPARAEARWRTHRYISLLLEAARSWPGWASMPASRWQVLEALLAEAHSRGWPEFECSERYLVAVVIRHRLTGPAGEAGRRPLPISAATCHRALVDLRDAGWITLSREGCKIARRPRRWRITQPPETQPGSPESSPVRPPPGPPGSFGEGLLPAAAPAAVHVALSREATVTAFTGNP